MSQPVHVQVLDASDARALAAVIALGDRYRKTLGFMPREGFRDRAHKGQILVAIADGTLAGYAMFDLPGIRVKLVHLCVGTDHRGAGVARALVDALSARYSDRDHIELRCRRDWPADKMWPNLGFEPVNELPGRAKQESVLTVWLKSHHTPTLFTFDGDRSLLCVALDTNVINDLHSLRPGRDSEQAEALTAPWLSDEVTLVTTPQIRTELNRITSRADRKHFMNAVSSYESLAADPREVSELGQRLVEAIDPKVIAADPTLRDDCKLVASACIAGAHVFATRDANVLKYLPPVLREFSDLAVLPPTAIATRVDEVKSAAAYSPRSLHDTTWSISEVDSGAEPDLADLINLPEGERRSKFTALLRATPTRPQGGSRLVVQRAGEPPTAYLAAHVEEARLVVTTLRVRDTHPLARTIATQTVWILRDMARRRAASQICVNDPKPSRAAVAALRADGFQMYAEQWVGLVLDACHPWKRIREEVSALLPDLVLPLNAPAGVEAAALESDWWPARISDADIPSYLIPIQPRFADRLFGRRPELFNRDDSLGLSREHVYYRAPKPQPLSAPGRILWYVSQPEKAVVACSSLTDVVLGKPRSLHRQYGRLGVWNSASISGAAKDGQACAVVFRNTQLFANNVPLEWLRRHRRGNPNWNFPGPLRLDPDVFNDAYTKGTQGG